MAVAVPVPVSGAVVPTALRPRVDWRESPHRLFEDREFVLHVVNPAALHFYVVLLAQYLNVLSFDDAPLFF